MAYFNQAFLDFFNQLAENNSSEWFADHKSTYEKEVKKPFLALVGDAITQIQKYEPGLIQQPKDAIFRINRDIRFSNDKRPYKEHVAALISRHGKKTVLPAFFIQIGAKEIWIGGGAYEVSKDHLARIRSEIYYSGAEFRRLLAEPGFQQYYGGQIQGERNKILPSPYKEAVADEPYLAHKQFYYMNVQPGSAALRPDLLQYVVDCYLAGVPMSQFLEVAMTDQPAED